MDIVGGAGSVIGAASGIANLASSLAARLGGTSTSYFKQLRRASFRDVPFISLGSDNAFGRRKQVHVYPQRDVPWVEDLGRGIRQFRMFGFVVGDDVIAQRDLLIAACEMAGDGDLVHPSLGRRTVSLVDFHSVERWERGRYFEFQFVFIEGGPRVYPTSTTETTSEVTKAASLLDLSAASAFASRALSILAEGAAVVGQAVSTALGWYNTAMSAVSDARNLFKLLTNLPGDFGRFLGSSTTPSFSRYAGASNAPASVNQAGLVASATSNREAVTTASAALGVAAAGLDATSIATFTNAAQAVTASVLSATTDPTDSVRLLSTLAQFTPSEQTTDSTVGASMATMQSACGDLFRRSAIASVARASATYLPSSSDDAVSMRDRVIALIDSEIGVAGDQGEDGAYEALRSLRAAVIADLNQRGGALAAIRTYQLPGGLPALALANRLYRDATRADELVAQIGPVHPAFCPASFRALTS
ncbi:DNA circularization N-terminal domain-containing protein [Pandoraea pnomenusa]|uniref:DNA circularization protein n=1 Tax=Pandoraea pnomenusa TaxID=93220 RepID=UPI00333F99A9